LWRWQKERSGRHTYMRGVRSVDVKAKVHKATLHKQRCREHVKNEKLRFERLLADINHEVVFFRHSRLK
jgi:hypothetical protein